MQLTDAVTHQLIDAVREAGRVAIMPRFRTLSAADIATKSGPDDLVTIADTDAEALIADRVRALLPGAFIVGEEAVAADPTILERMPDAQLAVVIDPVDGTGNFARGLAVFGTILAVVVNGVTELGLLYDPVMDDWILARRGQGVVFGTPHGTRPLPPTTAPGALAQASGYVSLHLFPDAQQAGLAAAFPRFKFVGNLRCSCHEYRMIAQGHAAFSYAAFAKPWDHLAGALVLQELGGGVVTADGAPYGPGVTTGPLLALGQQTPGFLGDLSATLGVG